MVRIASLYRGTCSTYRTQVALALKAPTTRFAIVPVVALPFHVYVGVLRREEFHSASLTRKLWLPMAHSIHMQVCSILGAECAGAGLALVCRWPVVEIIHMLLARALAPEESTTGLAFSPVAVVIHVVVTVLLPVELVNGGLIRGVDPW